MIARWMDKFNKKKDDRGSALVMVIISIAFIGTLVAMMVYLVYYNYLMKYTDRSAKDNFYTAESALNEIKAGIEKDVSEAMVESYYKVLSEHTADTAQNQQAYFEIEYKESLKDILQFQNATMGASGLQEDVHYYEPSNLAAYWVETPRASAPGQQGAYIETLPHGSWTGLATDDGLNAFKSDGPVVVYKAGNVIELKNVRISYTDEDGYVSIIETDIDIETPEINFANVMSLPKLETYSMISAGGIYNGYQRSSTTHKPVVASGIQTSTIVTGNVCGGEKGIYVDGVGGQISFELKPGDTATGFTLTADKISASNGRNQRETNSPASGESILISTDYEVFARNLYVESATMDVAADCFIQDDLTLDGTYPKIVMSGRYYGYGSEYGTAENNSAILLNGAHSTVDFSNLQQLTLAGHAYVGGVHYNATDNNPAGDYVEDWDDYNEEKKILDKTGDTAEWSKTGTQLNENVSVSNNSDVLMGQSVAVKSDQLMYMVPVECMGYDGDTQILAKNPMTYEEYTKFATTYIPEYDANGKVVMEDGQVVYTDQLKYTAVRLDVIMNKVGASPNSYGASYTPVFRRVNGTILVYFYLNFTSDEKANQFFRDYYNADKDAFNRYFNTYVASYSINSDILNANNGLLSIAGNMLYKRGNTVYLKEDTFDEDLVNFEAMENNRKMYLSYYQGLSKYLMKTTDDLSASQLKNDVFTNIAVDEDTFADYVQAGAFKTYKNTDDKVVAIVVNNAKSGSFVLEEGAYPDLHLIIASGDVTINVRNFDGLIFSGGNIYIGSNNDRIRIDYDPAEVQKAMTAKTANGDYVFEVLQNGIAYANSLGTTDADLLDAIEEQKERDVVRAADLVKFVNWNKE